MLSNLLHHSQADIVRALLVQAELATDPPSIIWPVYSTSEPDLPDDVLTVFDTAGEISTRTAHGDRGEHYGIQVRVRASTHDEGFLKAKNIAYWMDELLDKEWVIVGDAEYLIQTIIRTGPILSLGTEVPASRRRIFTINALVVIKRNED